MTTTSLQNRIIQAKNDGKYIQTSRLFLMPLDVSDAAEAFKWCGDPDVTEFMNYTIYTNVSDVAQWISEAGYNCFGFFLRENGQLIGSGDVHPNKNGAYELGYNLAKAYWGKGYCTEASKAMLAYRVAQGYKDFVSEHATDNVRSGRVIKKCGFVFRSDGSYTTFDGTRTFNSRKYILRIDSRNMDVDGRWFEKIVDGSKTIELRLNDEKRRGLKIGDYVVLNNLCEHGDLRKCVVKVTDLHYFNDFKELYASLDMSKCGYPKYETPNPNDMFSYYSAERQSLCGVVGIEFEFLAAV